jgi:hypothetical protein
MNLEEVPFTLVVYSAQPFVMKSFTLNVPSKPRLNPANRFYLDRNAVLFNCEDEVRLAFYHQFGVPNYVESIGW